MQALERLFITVISGWGARRADERGATAVEYGLIVALIAAVVIAGVALLGTFTRDNYSTITDSYPS